MFTAAAILQLRDAGKMTNTGLHSWTQLVPNRAQGYSPIGVRDLCNAQPYDYSIGTGAGSVWSTVDDLRHWFEVLRSGAILANSSVDELFGISSGNPLVGGRFAVAKRTTNELTGWDGVGFASALEYSARDNLLTIVLTNRNRSDCRVESCTGADETRVR